MKLLYTTICTLFISFSYLVGQDLYDPNNVTIITIDFEDSNWDETLDDFFAADDGERLMATVEINGEAFDSVGVRYRGGSTFNANYGKNPLNIKLDYLKNQDFKGFEVLKLSNGAKDPSFLREVASYEIAREYMKAPQANYAQVYINGSYHGLYANVESINSKFVEEAFLSDNNNPRFECSPSYDFDFPNPPFGCTQGHGSGLEYLGDGIICYFDHYDINGDVGWEAIRDLSETIQNDPSNARAIMDVDAFLWMSAFNNWLVNLDSYLGAVPNNYYIFQKDNGRFAPIVNDLNESFGRYPWLNIGDVGGTQPSATDLIALSPFAGEGDEAKPVLNMIYSDATLKRMYVAHYRTMLNENIVGGAFEERLEELQSMIQVAVEDDPNNLYTTADFLDNLNLPVEDFINGEMAYGLMDFVNPRYDYLQSLPEFQAIPPTVGTPQWDPTTPLPLGTVTITADINNANKVWLGSRQELNDAFVLTEMFDDGNNGDGAAGDGVYGTTVSVGVGGVQYYIYAENDNAGIFSPEKAELEFHSIGAAGEVVINEFMADNETTIADPDGQFEDWVEFYNNSPNTVNLSGWYLSDKTDNLTKWQFPNGTFLDGNSYLIVWLDNDENQDGLHATFTISNSGEALVLTNPDLQVVDQIVFGPQEDDRSMARCPNGVGAFEDRNPTFNADNTSACVVSTEELIAGKDFQIFPNPTNDALNVLINDFESRSLRVFSALGQQVFETNFAGQTSISLSHLSNGVYFVKLDGAAMQKVILAK